VARTCYISFKTEDESYKWFIQNDLGVDMIDRSMDQPVDSTDEEYILRQIRERYLSYSTVTLHLIGTRSAEHLGWNEQRFIKRELQASLYDGENNSRSGILGVVLPSMTTEIFRGEVSCAACGGHHNHVAINDGTVVSEFSYNYYIPNGKCSHTEDERYCVLVGWDAFCAAPEVNIEKAFAKRSHPISEKVKVYGN